ncbi:MAG: hypothetical protein ACI9TH_005132 [Kiritimatiellia bacterium]|jgi:hypothetical protein
MNEFINTTIQNRFFAPMIAALETAISQRKCNEFSDEEFLLAAFGRVIYSCE